MVCLERTIGSEVEVDAPDGTPMCVGHVESRFGPFGDRVSVNAIYVHGLSRMYHRLRNHFGCTRRYSKVKRLKLKLV
jgi:hypothetical protein